MLWLTIQRAGALWLSFGISDISSDIQVFQVSYSLGKDLEDPFTT